MLNFCPFLPDIGFQRAEEFVVIFDVFFVNDTPNVLYRGKIWTEAGQLSAWTLLIQSHAVVIAAVCGLHCPAEIHVIWGGAYVALKPLNTFQHS